MYVHRRVGTVCWGHSKCGAYVHTMLKHYSMLRNACTYVRMYVHTLGGNEGFAGHCALWKEAKEALFPTLTVLLCSSYYIRTYVGTYVQYCTCTYIVHTNVYVRTYVHVVSLCPHTFIHTYTYACT